MGRASEEEEEMEYPVRERVGRWREISWDPALAPIRPWDPRWVGLYLGDDNGEKTLFVLAEPAEGSGLWAILVEGPPPTRLDGSPLPDLYLGEGTPSLFGHLSTRKGEPYFRGLVILQDGEEVRMGDTILRGG